jgi:hypothetical protein
LFPDKEQGAKMNGHNSIGTALLWVDFCSCAYEAANSPAAGGVYVFRRHRNRQYRIESPLPEPLRTKLEHIFRQCVVCYLPFVQDPEGFLHDVQHTLLWDERSGEYAAAIKHRGPEERSFVWLRLKPNGFVFASLLSIAETAEESKKWRLVRVPPGLAVLPSGGGMGLQRNLNSHRALEEFPAFLAKHRGLRDYLYVNSLGIYQDIVASPAQTRGETAGPREAALGFVSDRKGHVVILAKESTGHGWTLVSVVSRASAGRLRARLSGPRKNSGGIRWKPIDVPYGAMVYMDDKIVFYKVIKLLKPGGGRAGYMFEFRPNGGKAYIRFPYVFRSCKKMIDFAERANAFRLKMWIRAGNK